MFNWFKKHDYDYEYPIKKYRGYEDVRRLDISENATYRAKLISKDTRGRDIWVVQYNEGDGWKTYYETHPAGGRAIGNLYSTYRAIKDFPGIKMINKDGTDYKMPKEKKTKPKTFTRVII